MGISTFDEATRPGGTGFIGPFIVTFYKLLCPQCKTITVGDDVYGNWRESQGVTCRKCGLTSMPETRKVDMAT